MFRKLKKKLTVSDGDLVAEDVPRTSSSAFIIPGELEQLEGKHTITGYEEMHFLANWIASELETGDILLLYGDIGAGKTTFTKSLATELQVGEEVTSPTFALAVEYDIPSNHKFDQLVHVDLYRLPDNLEKAGSSVDVMQMRELFMSAEQHRRVVVVEWAERLGTILPKRFWKLEFEHGQAETERHITVTPPKEEK